MSGEGKRLCKKECYEVYASWVFRIVKAWWLWWTGHVAWMETWNFVVWSRLEDSAEDKSVVLKWILGKYAVMVYNIDKNFLGYQLHQEVGWWSKPTFWEPPWFHDDGNIDGFWNATSLAVQQRDVTASLRRFRSLLWICIGPVAVTSVLGILTLWSLCQIYFLNQDFDQGPSVYWWC
jgi:hypothetical protein